VQPAVTPIIREKDAWMERVLVTGGAGFIGANFVAYLLARSCGSLLILDKLTYAGHLASLAEALPSPGVRFVEGDVADRSLLDSLLLDYHPTAIVHFAAESHVDRSIDDPSPFLETNVCGTFALLEATRHYLSRLDPRQREAFRLLHVSTDEVYGSLGPDGLFSEATPYAPNSPYAASKAAADHLMRAWYETYRLPILITNCSNNYGPYQFPEKLIPLMLLNGIEGRPLPIYGDGGNTRDWLFVEDHCVGLGTVLCQGLPGQKYNIGGENERTNLQIVDLLCAELERLFPAASNPALQALGQTSYRDLQTFVPDRPGHDRRYAIDARKIRTELGWRPSVDFETGLARTVEWYLTHRKWVETIRQAQQERPRRGLCVSSDRLEPGRAAVRTTSHGNETEAI
jgi:dTDP-glucose 4,6-dehydratase